MHSRALLNEWTSYWMEDHIRVFSFRNVGADSLHKLYTWKCRMWASHCVHVCTSVEVCVLCTRIRCEKNCNFCYLFFVSHLIFSLLKVCLNLLFILVKFSSVVIIWSLQEMHYVLPKCQFLMFSCVCKECWGFFLIWSWTSFIPSPGHHVWSAYLLLNGFIV